MQTKLTIRLDESLIRRAKAYARRSGKSVSGIVADFFSRLDDPAERETEAPPPAVRSLVGALGNEDAVLHEAARHARATGIVTSERRSRPE